MCEWLAWSVVQEANVLDLRDLWARDWRRVLFEALRRPCWAMAGEGTVTGAAGHGTSV